MVSIAPAIADDFTYALSQAGKLYGEGNISAAHYWYMEAQRNANSREKLRQTLPALAITSIELGEKDESLKYLKEFHNLYPDSQWSNQFIKKYSLTIPDDFYNPPKGENPLLFIIIAVGVIFLIVNSNKKSKRKSRAKSKKSTIKILVLFFSIVKTTSRVRHLMTIASTKPPVFISYSRQDKKFLDELKEHLTVYERRGLIEYWDDSKIQMGMLWRLEIKQALSSAKIAILLVSRPYLASKFIVNNELPPLLRSAKEHNAEIIPVMVSPCPYDISELGKIQASNSLLKPLKDLSPSERDIEYLRVLDRVAELLQE